jgi:hypothetical protein
MKFTIPFPNDNNATKGIYFLSSSSTPSAMKTAPKKFTIPFHNDNNATKGAYFSSSFSTRRVIPIIEGWSCDKCMLCATQIAKTKTKTAMPPSPISDDVLPPISDDNGVEEGVFPCGREGLHHQEATKPGHQEVGIILRHERPGGVRELQEEG